MVKKGKGKNMRRIKSQAKSRRAEKTMRGILDSIKKRSN